MDYPKYAVALINAQKALFYVCVTVVVVDVCGRAETIYWEQHPFNCPVYVL